MTTNSSARDAQAIWTAECAKCHGADGKGQTRTGRMRHLKDLTAPDVKAALKNEAMFETIRKGLKNEAGITLMKPIQYASDEEVKSLIQLIRGLK